MPHNLTETATYDAVVPVPDDGDARTAASVIAAVQPITNRTKFLHDKGVAGDVNIRRYASYTAITNAAPPPDGTMAFVAALGGKTEALYVYDANETTAPNGGIIIQPSTLPAAGRWVFSGGMLDPAGGAGGDSARASIPYPNFAVRSQSGAYTAGTVTVPVDGVYDPRVDAPFTFAGSTGDKIDISITCSAQCANSSGALLGFKIWIFDGTSSGQLDDTLQNVGLLSAAVAPIPVHLRTVYTLPATHSAYKIQLGAQAFVGSGLIYMPVNFSVRQERP